MDSQELDKVPTIVFEQLVHVRNKGDVNMLDRVGVSRCAYDLDMFDLVVYLSDMRDLPGAVNTHYMNLLHEFGEYLSPQKDAKTDLRLAVANKVYEIHRAKVIANLEKKNRTEEVEEDLWSNTHD